MWYLAPAQKRAAWILDSLTHERPTRLPAWYPEQGATYAALLRGERSAPYRLDDFPEPDAFGF